jgi:hypothetical protein
MPIVSHKDEPGGSSWTGQLSAGGRNLTKKRIIGSGDGLVMAERAHREQLQFEESIVPIEI